MSAGVFHFHLLLPSPESVRKAPVGPRVGGAVCPLWRLARQQNDGMIGTEGVICDGQAPKSQGLGGGSGRNDPCPSVRTTPGASSRPSCLLSEPREHDFWCWRTTDSGIVVVVVVVLVVERSGLACERRNRIRRRRRGRRRARPEAGEGGGCQNPKSYSTTPSP